MSRRRDEAGQTTMLIVVLAAVLMMTIAVVVDASAAYLQRQGLSNVADGAALHGADAAASGTDVYEGGLGENLVLDEAAAHEGVAEYVRTTGAAGRFPGLTYSVHVDHRAHRVVVLVRAPLDLPLTIPGSPEQASVSSTGNATVTVGQ